PLNTPGSPQSKPSGARNRTVSSRSSTTRPMWTKLVTPGRWLSIEVKRLLRSAGCRGREDIGRGPIPVRAARERALAARRCVDELGVRPFRRRRRVRRGCCDGVPAVPIERPPTVEEVPDELRARLTLVALRAQHDGEVAR